MLGILGVMAVVGIFFLVSTVIGFVTVMPKANRRPAGAGLQSTTHPEGTLVTDEEGPGDLMPTMPMGCSPARPAPANVQSIEAIPVAPPANPPKLSTG